MRRIRRQAVTNEVAGASETGETASLKIGEVARRAGVGVETLRFYERSGLLDRPAGADGDFCGLIESADLSAMKPERNNLKWRGK